MTDKEKIKSKLENLIKEWHLGRSAEAKYRCEAYKELLEYINSLQEEPVSEDLKTFAKYEKLYRHRTKQKIGRDTSD